MIAFNFKALFLSKDLLFAWTGRNIRGRYQQSALGWLWAIIQPVVSVIILTLIFTRIVPIDTGDTPYIIFSYVAIVPWTFLSSSLGDMTASLVTNMSLIKKIYFPREAIPIAAMLARLMDFGVAAVLIVILMIIFKMPVYLPALLFLPLILAVQIILILGLGMALATLNIFYRDVQSVLTLVIQIWFYASPIIYPITMVPKSLRTLYFLNPMAGILESYRDVVIRARIPGIYLLPATVISLIIFIIGYWAFKRVEFKFADVV